jgi:hypothetical protein
LRALVPRAVDGTNAQNRRTICLVDPMSEES